MVPNPERIFARWDHWPEAFSPDEGLGRVWHLNGPRPRAPGKSVYRRST